MLNDSIRLWTGGKRTTQVADNLMNSKVSKSREVRICLTIVNLIHHLDSRSEAAKIIGPICLGRSLMSTGQWLYVSYRNDWQFKWQKASCKGSAYGRVASKKQKLNSLDF